MSNRSSPTWKLVLVLLGGLVYGLYTLVDRPDGPPSAGVEREQGSSLATPSASSGVDPQLLEAIAERRSDVWVETDARVTRELRDDTRGSRHQRFLVDVAGHSILIAHNIDLAERVPIAVGDRLRLRGEFEWNEKGGVVHWTHHDPRGRRTGGWIEHDGEVYR